MKKVRAVHKSPHKDKNTSTHSYSLVSKMLVFVLCVGKDVCLAKQMAMKRAREKKSWESCMEEFILYVSPNWSPWQFPVSLIHTWQQINLSTLFRHSLSSPLGIEIHYRKCSYLHVSLRMNSPMCVHTCQVQSEREESVKRNESTEKPGAPRSHFMPLQTGTLDSRSLAYFSCHPAAKSDYYPTALGK